MSTENVTVTVGSNLLPLSVISTSCTYEFPISVAGTYTLFLLRLYIIRILYVVAQATIGGVDKNLLSTAHSLVAKRLTFLLAISTCHSYQNLTLATGQ